MLDSCSVHTTYVYPSSIKVTITQDRCIMLIFHDMKARISFSGHFLQRFPHLQWADFPACTTQNSWFWLALRSSRQIWTASHYDPAFVSCCLISHCFDEVNVHSRYLLTDRKDSVSAKAYGMQLEKLVREDGWKMIYPNSTTVTGVSTWSHEKFKTHAIVALTFSQYPPC